MQAFSLPRGLPGCRSWGVWLVIGDARSFAWAASASSGPLASPPSAPSGSFCQLRCLRGCCRTPAACGASASGCCPPEFSGSSIGSADTGSAPSAAPPAHSAAPAPGSWPGILATWTNACSSGWSALSCSRCFPCAFGSTDNPLV